MLLTLLGMLANMVRALHTKTVRVSHRLTCISDGTERPLVGKSTCFHRLDVATLHWHGNLAAIRSSRPQPFGNTGSGQPRHQPEAFSPVSSPSSPLSSSSPASPSSFSPTSSSAESPAEPSSPTWSSAQHMTFHPVPTPLLPRRTYADAARNGRAQNGHATATHSGVVGKPEKEQQQQQQQQRFFASNGSADMAASRPVPTATAAMHALNLRSTVSCSTPFPSSSSSALTATTAAATSTSGIGRVPKTSSTLEGSVLVRDPAGLHLPPTIVNHAFLRSGAQFTEPQLEVARNSSILGVSNDNAAAGDQNEMHLHRSRNRRLEEFYERMQQQHAKPA